MTIKTKLNDAEVRHAIWIIQAAMRGEHPSTDPVTHYEMKPRRRTNPETFIKKLEILERDLRLA